MLGTNYERANILAIPVCWRILRSQKSDFFTPPLWAPAYQRPCSSHRHQWTHYDIFIFTTHRLSKVAGPESQGQVVRLGVPCPHETRVALLRVTSAAWPPSSRIDSDRQPGIS